ncbi:hypothetical protein CL620_03435 [archaeon]|jgi:hypothetical protein|nr:hypothetical protein [archaeon]
MANMIRGAGAGAAVWAGGKVAEWLGYPTASDLIQSVAAPATMVYTGIILDQANNERNRLQTNDFSDVTVAAGAGALAAYELTDAVSVWGQAAGVMTEGLNGIVNNAMGTNLPAEATAAIAAGTGMAAYKSIFGNDYRLLTAAAVAPMIYGGTKVAGQLAAGLTGYKELDDLGDLLAPIATGAHVMYETRNMAPTGKFVTYMLVAGAVGYDTTDAILESTSNAGQAVKGWVQTSTNVVNGAIQRIWNMSPQLQAIQVRAPFVPDKLVGTITGLGTGLVAYAANAGRNARNRRRDARQAAEEQVAQQRPERAQQPNGQAQ